MLEVHDIWKSYEGRPLLCGVSFTVAPGETVCLLGASGSGKSTLLRIVAGLDEAEGGEVCWDGEPLGSWPAHLRNFGLVFQEYALFPHLTVAENVAFGLRMQGLPREAVRLRVVETLEMVDLAEFGKRRVTDLSGGEQQRVALARALAPRPRLLMFDEPLGALDRALKDGLLDELRRILRESRVPAIYVTHDQEEAFAIAGRVLLLHEGQIVRSGPPVEVWGRPGSAWAARFLGLGSVLEGIVRLEGGRRRVETAAGVFEPACGHAHPDGERVSLLLRPGGASRREVRGGADDCLRGRVAEVLFRQDRFRVTLENGLFFFLPDAPGIGEEICLVLPASAVQCLS